jgi:MYXO-CTERM domain-containing protein
MNLRAITHAALGATLAASAFVAPSPAAACGGFFCDSAQPVNQQAERIIFARQPDGSVVAVIQIQYQGPSEKFAWMLPVAGSPTIEVSSNAAFDRIQAASNPLYRLNTTTEGTCRDEQDIRGNAASGDGDSAPSADGGEGGGVTVVDSGSVGPYDYVIIALDPEAMDLVAVAIDWLQENGYDVPELGSAVLRPYLEGGMNLLAFKLTKGNDTGSIRPVKLSFGQGLPSIPIRPTAVAAQPDMGVMVWVLGEHRAIPANYRSLELNDALINWLNPNLNYNDVVIRAANEAQGQGFVTEHAGSAPDLGQAIWQPWEAEQWRNLQLTDWSNREGELVNALGDFAALDGMRELLSAFLVPPSGVSEDDFYSCVACYVDYQTADIEGFEPGAFMADMQTQVIDPLVDTQKLFAAATTSTRLYTTMSAHEMTVDPLFDFNPDLPAVSNLHEADRIIECSRFVDRVDAPWRVELANGQVVRGQGTDWPFATDTEAMPANSRITRVGNRGTGEVVEDNVATISQALSAHNKTVPGPKSDDGGCSVRPGNAPFGPGGLFVAASLGLIAVRRRRESRRPHA